MTNDEIAAIWNGMPGGYDGFCKTWGFIQFARRILEVANIQSTTDGERYRTLRDPGCPENGTVYACVYVHAPGTIPYQRAVVGRELDSVIDFAIAQKQEE
ncbi:hypothetical protein [Paraburkholderia acidisoli]|uniref:Uncharacterized protein n=1 Tax=Paraburkholderia acidisoli TaxID=2571748 RepID=A0A7Z2JKF5_9BURK|nr:hypothetical protein [Paraburkholderia acidisoli]QGZ66410.1 hypothetical protein FAZ98_32010 [Paraburkholderia acidisoli]